MTALLCARAKGRDTQVLQHHQLPEYSNYSGRPVREEEEEEGGWEGGKEEYDYDPE